MSRATRWALFASVGVHVVAGVLLVRVLPAQAPPVPRKPIELRVVSVEPHVDRAPREARVEAPRSTRAPAPAPRPDERLARAEAARAEARARAEVVRPATPDVPDRLDRLDRLDRPAAPGVAVSPPARDTADPRVNAPGAPSSPLARGPADLDLRLRADPRGPRVSTGGGDRGDGGGRSRGGLPAGLQHAGEGTYRYEDHGFVANIDRDGTVHFRDRAPVGFSSPLSLSFDLTEAVMMLRDDDPYRPGKMKFLEETRELRARLCGEAHTERLQKALFALPKELDRTWRDPAMTPEARRRLLFQRWDECADARGDDELARAGALARATVLAYIRQHLPAGSPHAYTPAELLALNAERVSREPFAPYEAATPPPDRRPDGGT